MIDEKFETDHLPRGTRLRRPHFGAVPLPSLERGSLATRVATIMKRYLLAEGVPAGERLPSERRLAEAMSVSRTVLRESLGQLIDEGVIERASPRTLVVADFDRDRVAAELAPGPRDADARNLIELRVIIELGAVEAIIDRATEEDLRRIERWVIEGERCVEANRPLAMSDARFHSALLQALGNETVDALLPLIEEHMRQNVVEDAHHLRHTGTPEDYQVVADHRRIFEAVKRRDAPATRRLMQGHLGGYLRLRRASSPDCEPDVRSDRAFLRAMDGSS